jgi:Na+/H+ antiporter NhaC
MGLALIRGMKLSDVMDGFISGCRSMTIGAVILGLAVTLALVTKELDTAQYLVGLMDGAVPAVALPAMLTLLCMGIAFACGSSWGTYAVVFPVAMPLAWALHADPTYLSICFGAVLGGAVFGDQCSPISDTTILSSMFTGCDLMDHVGTQLPLALLAATIGGVASTLAAMMAL